MTFIVKPLVTEKMTKITDKSSVDKQLRALNPAAAQRLGAKEEKRVSVRRKRPFSLIPSPLAASMVSLSSPRPTNWRLRKRSRNCITLQCSM